MFETLIPFINQHILILSAILSFFCFYYRKEYNKLETWNDLYFRNVVAKFNLKYFYDKPIDIRKFIKEQDLINKPYIPTYIMYLIKKQDYDKIKKILIIDYKKNYPTANSRMLPLMHILGFLSVLGIIFLSIYTSLIFLVIFIASIYSTFAFILSFFTSLNVDYQVDYIFCLIISTLYIKNYELILKIIFYFFKVDPDEAYSQDIKIIKRIIKYRVASYDKHHKNFFYYQD